MEAYPRPLMIVGKKTLNPVIATEEKKKPPPARYINGSVKAIRSHFLSNFSSPPRYRASRCFLSAMMFWSFLFKNHAVSGEVGRKNHAAPPMMIVKQPSMMNNHLHALMPR